MRMTFPLASTVSCLTTLTLTLMMCMNMGVLTLLCMDAGQGVAAFSPQRSPIGSPTGSSGRKQSHSQFQFQFQVPTSTSSSPLWRMNAAPPPGDDNNNNNNNNYDDFSEETGEYSGSVDWDAEWKKVVKSKGSPTKSRPGKDYYKSEAEIAAIRVANEAQKQVNTVQDKITLPEVPSWDSVKGDWKFWLGALAVISVGISLISAVGTDYGSPSVSDTYLI
jgi:hypothetical protein